MRYRLPRLSPLTALVMAMVLLALGAWLGASLVTTPREEALRAETPPPSVITARVETRVVAQEIVTRGSVTPERSLQVITPSGDHLRSAGARWS